MKEKDESLSDLMEFTLFAAEVKPHFQSFLKGVFEGGGAGGFLGAPEGGDANRSCMPTEAIGGADGRFVEGILQERVDWQG